MNQKKTPQHRRPRTKKPSPNSQKPRSNQRSSAKKGPMRKPSYQSAILPDPKVLQEYDYAAEGSALKIIEMAKNEQQKRFAWEESYQLFYKKTQRIGQLFGFILALYLVWAVHNLALSGQETVAIALAISGFGALALTSVLSLVIAHRARGRQLKRNKRR